MRTVGSTSGAGSAAEQRAAASWPQRGEAQGCAE
jgi:hypothetical protein